jgi:hypothetical protein
MQKSEIESAARKVQFEIYSRRELLWPNGVPNVLEIFCPFRIADQLDLQIHFWDKIPSHNGVDKTAGAFDRANMAIAISNEFQPQVQRFTLAHEIGHFVLHPNVGKNLLHRDRPVFYVSEGSRPQIEKDADYFAACLLIPRKVLEQQFFARFGSKKPLPLSEAVLYNLGVLNPDEIFSAPYGSMKFANAVARAEFYNGNRFYSLAQVFKVSPSALAIRLRETGLVTDQV